MSKKVLTLLAICVGTLALGAAATFFWVIPNWNDIKQVFSSVEAFRVWIESLGWWGPVIYTVVQFAQVVIAPIPGNLTGLAGGALFGIWVGFLLTAIGQISGAFFVFFLGRIFGRSLLIKFVGEEKYNKYSKVFNGRAAWTLLIAFLLPVVPDDILCMLAGATPLSFRRFALMVFLGRIPSVFMTTLAGAGLLSLPELKLPIWAYGILGAIGLGLIWLYFANKEKIGKWVEAKLNLHDEPSKILPAK